MKTSSRFCKISTDVTLNCFPPIKRIFVRTNQMSLITKKDNEKIKTEEQLLKKENRRNL